MEITLRRDREELVATYGEELLALELEMEDRMVTLGRDQIRRQIARARELGNESGTSYGKALVARSIDELSQAIIRFIDKAKNGGAGRRHIAVKYLEQVDPDVAAFIALRMVVDSLTGKKLMMQSVAVVIGKRLEDEARFAEFKDTDARMYNRALDKAKKGTTYHRKKATMSGYQRRFGEDWQSWPEQDMLHVGMCLIDMIVQTGLVEVGEQINTRAAPCRGPRPSTGWRICRSRWHGFRRKARCWARTVPRASCCASPPMKRSMLPIWSRAWAARSATGSAMWRRGAFPASPRCCG